MDMQGLIEEMSALIAKIKSGDATRGEIEAFAAASAELHERAVVLRYKYYEAKVYNTAVEAVAAVPSTVEARVHSEVEVADTFSEVEPFAETPAEESEMGFDLFDSPSADASLSSESTESELVIEEPEVVSEVLETEEEPVAAETAQFAAGGTKEDNEEAFDLFSLDAEEEEEPIISMFETAEPEMTSESELDHGAAAEGQTPSMEEGSDEAGAEEAPIHSLRSGVWSAPEAEEEQEVEFSSEEDSFIVEEESASLLEEGSREVTLVEESFEEEMDFTSPEPTTTPAPPIDLAASAAMHPVYSRLNNDDNSIAGRLMAVRLESLNGAFGFNERMQIVQELFNGSNDNFTQAIQELDNMPSKDAARGKVSKIATIYGWSADNRLALEFVQKVERRYA